MLATKKEKKQREKNIMEFSWLLIKIKLWCGDRGLIISSSVSILICQRAYSFFFNFLLICFFSCIFFGDKADGILDGKSINEGLC